jgi:hypothetical protein
MDATDPEAKRQAEELTDKIDDIVYERTDGGGGSGTAAAEIVRQLPELLYQAGWLPPDVLSRIQDWAKRTGELPEQHINRDTLNSHLVELAAILHSR